MKQGDKISCRQSVKADTLQMKQEDREREKETDLVLELRAGEEEEARQRNLGDLKVEIGGRAEEGSL